MSNTPEITDEALRERHFTSIFADGDMKLYIKVMGDKIFNVWVRFENGKYIVGQIPTTDFYYEVNSKDELDEKIKIIEGRV